MNKKYLMSIPEKEHKRFQTLYPRLMSVFLRRCIISANKNRAFFESVFFGTRDPYSSLGMNRPEYVVDND